MEQVISIGDVDVLRALFGPGDRHARRIRRRFGIDLVARDGGVKLVGEEEAVGEAAQALQQAIYVCRRDRHLSEEALRKILDASGEDGPPSRGQSSWRGIAGRSKGQEDYLKALHRQTITVAIGPAGTGKTYLAAATAVSMLRQGDVRKIVLCRPAVEADEHLGFLPGDFQQKVNPYLRPLYDALFSLLDVNQVRRYIDSDIIEIAPLAYMRGRTLERAYIILDEAQNTTPRQMKMFLTRMGRQSRIVVTGDVTQIDLPSGQASGLIEAAGILQGVEGISIIQLTRADIVRHPLVQRIVDAYERNDATDSRTEDSRPPGG